MRRKWILITNNALREHNYRYSRFVYQLNHSNVGLDRKILADLALNEPYSFKAVADYLMEDCQIEGAKVVNPLEKVNFKQAFEQNLLSFDIPKTEPKIGTLDIYNLVNPEHAGTEHDFLRISFREEDKKWLEEQQRMTLTDREQKRMPRMVVDETFEEDMSWYDHKKDEE